MAHWGQGAAKTLPSGTVSIPLTIRPDLTASSSGELGPTSHHSVQGEGWGAWGGLGGARGPALRVKPRESRLGVCGHGEERGRKPLPTPSRLCIRFDTGYSSGAPWQPPQVATCHQVRAVPGMSVCVCVGGCGQVYTSGLGVGAGPAEGKPLNACSPWKHLGARGQSAQSS